MTTEGWSQSKNVTVGGGGVWRALRHIKKNVEEEANSHIWHHHGGSLEKQPSGKYSSINKLDLAEENYAMLQVKVRLRNYVTTI